MDERFVTRYADGGISLERAQQYFREKRDLLVTKEMLDALYWRVARQWLCYI